LEVPGLGIYETLVIEKEPEAQWLQVLKAIGLWMLRIWRWLLRLPLFWV